MSEPKESLPAFLQLARRFPGAFLSLESVQKVLHSLQAAEGRSPAPGDESRAERFVDLLQPSPTMHQALAAQTSIGAEHEFDAGDGGTLQGVIRRLEKVLGTLEVKSSPGEVMEARLAEFEEEIGMAVEGRGGLHRLISSPDTTVEGLVMFLATYFDAAAPEPSAASTSTQ